MRRDVADISLADRVFAPHYARPLDQGCMAANVAIRSAPSENAAAVSELLRGEIFAVVDCSGAWAWGYGRHDNYVGYVPVAALGAATIASHVVAQPAALVFIEPNIKAPIVERLPMGARLAIDGIEGDFLRAANGFVHKRHVVATAEVAEDFVAVAERLIGTPYRWGGRSGDGIDCSGLVQLALAFAHIDCPRDSDQQREAVGEAVAEHAVARRGDLIFLPGHVGIMTDATTLLHANAWWIAVAREPLADVLARQPEGGDIIARRRIEA